MRAPRLALAATLAVLAGCALKSPPERAELAKQSLPNLQVPSAWIRWIVLSVRRSSSPKRTTT